MRRPSSSCVSPAAQRLRLRRLLLVCLGLYTVLLPACESPPPWQNQTLPMPEELTPHYLELNREWRYTLKLPGNGLRLGPIPDDAVLRLGVYDAGITGKHVTVYAGAENVAQVPSAPTPGWRDVRIPLDNPDWAGRTCRLWFEAGGQHIVAPYSLEAAADEKPPVLIFLIDTLRLDHLGCYGYARDTSPHLDAFAEDALRFTQLLPASSWTRPSVASLLYGVAPARHGAHDHVDVRRPGMPALADSLEEAGYHSAAFMTNVNCLPAWNMGTEFDRLVDIDSANWEKSDRDTDCVDAFIGALDVLDDVPWFAYVHTMAPHGPYAPPAPYDRRFASQDVGEREPVEIVGHEYPSKQAAIDLYDGEVAYADAEFGRAIAALRERDLYDDALIIVLSDHGEEFWEHGGTDHGMTLYEEQLRVPLLIKLPGNEHAGAVRHGLVEMQDIAPTILESLGLPPEPRFDGRSFVPSFVKADSRSEHMGFASLYMNAASMRTAKTPALKVIADDTQQHLAWYNLADDPGEQHPQTAAEQTATAAHKDLKTLLDRRSVEGAAGLHVLITDDPESAGDIAIEATGEDFGACRTYYPDELTTVMRHADSLHVQFRMQEKERYFPDAHKWHAEHQQDGARLLIEAPIESPFELRVTRNGEPVAAEAIHIGASGQHRDLSGTTLHAEAITADPTQFDVALLPRRFAVYVWYTPPPARMAETDIDAETRESLRALGYLE
ncbi:MAG: sulfatase [Candidatus Hydrogenedentota bacterium]